VLIASFTAPGKLAAAVEPLGRAMADVNGREDVDWRSDNLGCDFCEDGRG
jgi:hypothetical protein